MFVSQKKTDKFFTRKKLKEGKKREQSVANNKKEINFQHQLILTCEKVIFFFSPKVLIFFSPVLSLIFREKRKKSRKQKKALLCIYNSFCTSVLKGNSAQNYNKFGGMKLGELGGVIFTYIKFLVTVVNYVFSVVISDQSLRIRVFFDRNKTQQFSTTIMMAGTKKYSVILFQQSLRFFRESRKMIFFHRWRIGQKCEKMKGGNFSFV